MKFLPSFLLCVSFVSAKNANDTTPGLLRGSETKNPPGNSNKGNGPIRISDKGHAKGRSGPIRISGKGHAKGRSMEGRKTEGRNELTFLLGPEKDCRIEVMSNFKDRELTITRVGNDKSNAIDEEDRMFLAQLVADMTIEQGDSWEADTVMAQIERVSELLMDWPRGLDFDYEYDKVASEARDQERLVADEANPVPDDSPEPPENTSLPPARHLKEEESNHGRRLVRELCGSLNSFVESTHDDFDFGRNNDRTTYFAYVSNHPPCSGGGSDTWFWDNGWRCIQPDHDQNIEFAVGNCFGRCGAGCGGNNGRGTYTRDCLDHDNCVRFGHNIASPFCNDEFLTTADDAIFGDRCI